MRRRIRWAFSFFCVASPPLFVPPLSIIDYTVIHLLYFFAVLWFSGVRRYPITHSLIATFFFSLARLSRSIHPSTSACLRTTDSLTRAGLFLSFSQFPAPSVHPNRQSSAPNAKPIRFLEKKEGIPTSYNKLRYSDVVT